MNHEDGCFCELAPLYSLDLLTPQERQWVEQQVANSSELAAELAALQATVGAIAYAAPPLPVAADLKDRLFQRLGQAIPAEPTLNPAPIDPPVRDRLPDRPAALKPRSDRARTRPIWPLVGGAIAAIAVVALGVENDRLRQNAKSSSALIETLQRPDAVVHSLKGTEKATAASGRLVVSPSQKAIAILVQDLPQLASGQVYRLWALPTGATKPTYCGQFNDANQIPTHWAIPEASCSAAAQMLITAELAADPPVPAGPLVMKSIL